MCSLRHVDIVDYGRGSSAPSLCRKHRQQALLTFKISEYMRFDKLPLPKICTLVCKDDLHFNRFLLKNMSVKVIYNNVLIHFFAGRGSFFRTPDLYFLGGSSPYSHPMGKQQPLGAGVWTGRPGQGPAHHQLAS